MRKLLLVKSTRQTTDHPTCRPCRPQHRQQWMLTAPVDQRSSPRKQLLLQRLSTQVRFPRRHQLQLRRLRKKKNRILSILCDSHIARPAYSTCSRCRFSDKPALPCRELFCPTLDLPIEARAMDPRGIPANKWECFSCGMWYEQCQNEKCVQGIFTMCALCIAQLRPGANHVCDTYWITSGMIP